jgi:hypothetical protein
MSNLLERAIIDAKALKEAALKNAEQLVIEKYSKEIKDAMDNLLENSNPLIEEELEDEIDSDFSDPLSDMTGIQEPIVDEEEMTNQDPLSADSLTAILPDAFTADDNQIIRIKLDSLEADIEEPEGLFGGDDVYDDDEVGIDVTDDSFEATPDASFDATPDSSFDASADSAATADMVAEILGEMEIDEEEIDLEEIMERVRVEGTPQKSGWAGTPESVMQEYESMLLAREQDSEVKEENEELRKNVAALKQENKTLSSAALKLQEQNKKFNATFDTLQEKLETMNVSNAKLLYINQALENASLNERQKRKIVEAISKAGTVQEAKIVFETLSDTVATTSDVRKEATLSEMVSRKSSLLVAARNEQPKKDANPMLSRMQKLAGITTH